MTPYLLTASGIRIDLLNPRPEDVTIGDVAPALAQICRYTGHARAPGGIYSVAQHSVYVSNLLALWGHSNAIQIQGLIHDAHEAYTGDVASPIKRAIRAIYLDQEGAHPDDPGPDPWRVFESRHAQATRARFRVPDTLAAPVHKADLSLLASERAAFMPNEPNDAGGWPDEPAVLVLSRAWTVAESEARFLEHAARLGVV